MNTEVVATTKKPVKLGLSLGKLSAVAQIALNKPTQAPDAEIELALIYTLKQVRTTFLHLEELAESIKQLGIIEPLVLHAEADGRYRLIIGGRRFLAAPLAGLFKVPVIIKRGLTELQIRELQVAENNDRDNLTAFDEAQGVIEDVEKFGTKEAMRIWNRGESWVSKRMAVGRYADPVREMLQQGLCGDFEVLHCLNQIYEIEPVRTEFYRMRHRFTEGLPPSRDEARNTLARMKAWTQQQAALNTNSKKAEAKKLHTKNKKEAAGTEREQAEQDLALLRKRIFDGGEVILAEFARMKTHTAALGLELHDMEWVLYSGFLAMAFPMLEGVGSDRGLAYLKKLQGELKGKTPQALLETLMLDRPAEWRL